MVSSWDLKDLTINKWEVFGDISYTCEIAGGYLMIWNDSCCRSVNKLHGKAAVSKSNMT